MAKSILDIVIRTVKQGGGDKETVKGLVDLKKGLTAAVGGFTALVGAAYAVDKVLDETVGQFVKYADEVDRAKNLTGASAEETSRIIQSVDDLGISYESLTKSLTKANKEGVQPNLEGMAALSDQYLALPDSVSRAQFLLDKFGKSGADMARYMELGGAGIRDLAASIDDSLVVTDEGIQQAHAYQFALDTWGDSIQALKMDLAVGLLPAVTKMTIGLAESNNIREEANRLLQEGIAHNREEALTMAAAAVQTEYMNRALEEQTTALGEAGESAEEAAARYANLLDITMTLQDGYDGYIEKQAEINAQMAETNAQFAAGDITIEERDQKLQELNAALQENASEMEQWSKRTVFSLVQARLAAEGGIDAKEFAFLINLGEQMGIIDESTAEMAQGVNDSLENIDLGKPEEFYTLWQDIMALPHDQVFTVTTITNGSAGNTTDTIGGGKKYAIGGAYEAGQPMLVHQDEILVPNNGGYVLTGREAMQIASAAMGNRGSSKSMVIYGGLTVIAQGSVTDVLEELS